MKFRHWTPERDAELADMVRRGMTDRQIAAELRRTETSVGDRRRKLGFLREHKTPWKKRTILDTQQELTVEIAMSLGWPMWRLAACVGLTEDELKREMRGVM